MMEFVNYFKYNYNPIQNWDYFIGSVFEKLNLRSFQAFNKVGASYVLNYSLVNRKGELGGKPLSNNNGVNIESLKNFHIADVKFQKESMGAFIENDTQIIDSQLSDEEFQQKYHSKTTYIIGIENNFFVFNFSKRSTLLIKKRLIEKNKSQFGLMYINYLYALKKNKVIERTIDEDMLKVISQSSMLSSQPMLDLLLSLSASAFKFNSAYLINYTNQVVSSTYGPILNLNIFDVLTKDADVVLVNDKFDQSNFGINSILILPVGDLEKYYLVLLSTESKVMVNQERIGRLELFISLLNKYLTKISIQSDVSKAYEQILKDLIQALEAKDDNLMGHHQRVALLTYLLAKKLGISFEKRSLLVKAALLHDIGLMAPAGDNNLISQEFNHPLLGRQMLVSLEHGKELSQLVLLHHENIDGFGYPQAVKIDSNNDFEQILSLAEFIVEYLFHGKNSIHKSLQSCIQYLFDGKSSYSATVSQAAVEILTQFLKLGQQERQVCKNVFGVKSKICRGCAAFTSSQSCWSIPAIKRKCQSHGSTTCEDCLVYKTWGPKL